MKTRIMNSIIIVIISIFLIALQLKPLTWIIVIMGLIISRKDKTMLILYFALIIISLSPIKNEATTEYMIIASMIGIMTILLPFLLSIILKENHIIFPLKYKGNIYLKLIKYIFFTTIISYFIIELFFNTTNVHMNWSFSIQQVPFLFFGILIMGFWEELFFTSIIFNLLLEKYNFVIANILQSVLYTSFMYTLGFKSYAPLLIFPLSLIRGKIYKKTKSLLFLFIIHLIIDLFIFLKIVGLHYPQLLVL